MKNGFESSFSKKIVFKILVLFLGEVQNEKREINVLRMNETKVFVDQTLNKRLQKKLFNQYLRLSRWDERKNKRFPWDRIL